jgi:hypothetical protein
MNSSSIIHTKTIKVWKDLYEFDDNCYQIKYKTEGPLIPENNSKLPVLILLSNPHPHSVKL